MFDNSGGTKFTLHVTIIKIKKTKAFLWEMITEDHEGTFLDSSQEDESSLQQFPKYCYHYKFFLVEELALEQDYRQLHYGKCSLVGKIRENISGNFELENIHLPNIQNEYRLPEGTLTIRLLTLGYNGPQLLNGRFGEVCGEVVLLNVLNPPANIIPLTARGVHEQLLRTDDLEERQEILSKLLETHKPAIKLWIFSEVDRAGELAERNLEIRMISQEHS